MKKRLNILIIVIVILLTGFLIGRAVIISKVRTMIEHEVAALSKGQYDLKIGGVSLVIPTRSLAVKNVRLSIDSLVANKEKNAFANVRLTADRISLKGFQYDKVNDRISLRMRGLDMQNPHIRVSYRPPVEVDPSQDPDKSIQEQTVQTFDQLIIGTVNIQEGDFSYEQIRDEDTVLYEVKNLNLLSHGFERSADKNVKGKVFFNDDLTVSFERFNYTFSQQAFKLEVDSALMDTKVGNFLLGETRLLPQYPKEGFTKRTKKETDWTQVIAGGLSCYEVDFVRFFDENELHIDSINLRNIELISHKDRRVAQQPVKKRLLHETIKNLPFGLSVRTIALENLNPTYEEIAQYGVTPGIVSFNGITGEFRNVTNIPAVDESYMVLTAKGKLLDQGPIEVKISLPVDSLNDRFEVKGRLGSMNLSALNQMITPLANAEIKTCDLKSMDFHIIGHEKQSATTMTLLYNDLEVTLVKPTMSGEKERKFISGIINTFFLKSNNPDRNGTRHAKTTTERTLTRSQWNYLWKSLFGGVKETAGIGEK